MKIVDLKFGKNDEFIVDGTAGTLSFEVKGELLGNPEDLRLSVSIKSMLLAILPGVSSPFARLAVGILINLFA